MKKILDALYFTMGAIIIAIAFILALPMLLWRYGWELSGRMYNAIENYPRHFRIKW